MGFTRSSGDDVVCGVGVGGGGGGGGGGDDDDGANSLSFLLFSFSFFLSFIAFFFTSLFSWTCCRFLPLRGTPSPRLVSVICHFSYLMMKTVSIKTTKERI